MAKIMPTARTDSPARATPSTPSSTYRTSVLYSVAAATHILLTQLTVALFTLVTYGDFTEAVL